MKLKQIPSNATLVDVISITNENIEIIESAFNSVFSTIESIVLPINVLEVFYGTSYDDVISNLPEFVTVNLDDGNELTLSVTWTTDNYDQHSLNTYTFTGKLDLSNGLINPLNVIATVDVKVVPTKVIGFQSFEINVGVGSTLESLQAQLPENINILLQSEIDGSNSYVILANWTFDNFDTSVENQFRIIALPNLPNFISNVNQIEFEAFVNVI